MTESHLFSPSLSELPPPPSGKTGWPWTEASPPPPDTLGGAPWPRISVVTPSYNQGQFIEATIRSVLLQGYPNLEYIVIDGGSTDESVEIIHRYAPWLAFWVSEPDRGQANAINKGFACATGEILAWLNSDDLYHPEALRSVGEAARANLQGMLFYGDSTLIDADAATLGGKSLTQFSLKRLLKGQNMSQPATFWRRCVLERLGGLDETLHYGLDFEFFLRIWSHYTLKEKLDHPFVHIPRVLASTRRWEGTKSLSQAARFGKEYQGVLDRFFQQPDLPPEIQELRRFAYSRVVYRRQARLLWAQGQAGAARQFYWRNFAIDPSLKGKWAALRQWLATFRRPRL